ncbi:hypothetical protein ABW19_dt0201868 [Dactylella cylindrospora]|nr:hypothetical protein ABW19_dt0201868 [Dactylella cylindrospora]
MLAERRSKGSLMNIEFGRPDMAYVDFMVALEILVTILPSHREYPTWSTRSSQAFQDYKTLRRDMMKHLPRIEEIKEQIIASNAQQNAMPSSSDSIATVLPSSKPESNGLQPVAEGKKPPPRPAKPKDLQNYHSGDVRTSIDRPPSRDASTSINGDNLAFRPKRTSQDSLQDRFDRLRKEASFPRPPEPTYSPVRQFADNSTYFPVPGESQARPLARASSSTSLDNYRPASTTSALPTLPGPSAAPIPPTSTGDTTISAERLSEYLGNISATSVLIIDVRERSEYDQGHIFTRSIIMSADQLEDALSISPDKEHSMFINRHQYDLVVYHDQATTSLHGYDQNTDRQAQKALKILVQAIYEFSYQKPLRNPPKLLVGGIDAWTEYNGPTSLVQTPASQKVAGLARMGAKTATNSHSTIAARRREKARAALPGQVLPDAERSEIMHNAQPINQEEEEQWIARLKRENTTITIKKPTNLETGDLKSRNRTTSIVSIDQFDLSPSIEDFFQRFPAIGKDPADIPPMPTRGPPSPPPEGGLQQGAAYPVLPILGSTQQVEASPATSVDENEQPNIQPPSREPPAPPPVPAKGPSDTGLQRRNTIIDHVFHGFTDVNNPQFHPLPPASPSRPPPAVPKKSYSGVSEHLQPQAPALDPVTTPFIAPVSHGGFGTTGLKNLGNTCYMNSIIQCMSGTVPLARYFLSGTYKGHINRENRLGSRGIFAESFANLNRNLWEETYAFVSPVTIKDISGRLNSQFRGRDQQDAQEYLEFFLDYLHEDLNANAGRPKLRELTDAEERRREELPIQLASYYEWERYTHTNLSMIVKWFQGQFRSQLRCLKCGYTSTTYSPFMYLSLPIPASAKNSGCTLKDCMDEFTKEEILDGDDAWHCPVCKKARKASKQLSISRMPIVLIIHLKRFSSHGMWRDKVNTMVNFAKSVDLTRYVPPPLDPSVLGGKPLPATIETTPPFHYSLYAVTNHYGSLTSGHYTAFVRVSGGGTGGQVGASSVWHKFDDTKATKMEGDDVVVSFFKFLSKK